MLRTVASWFQRRIVLIWAAYFSILEILSWALADAPGCLISASSSFIDPDQNDRAGYNDNQHGCPTFFVGLLILISRADRFIEHHDKSIVAVFTVVLAISTILLWRATQHLYEAGERQLTHFEKTAERQAQETGASIAVARKAAEIGHLQFLATHRPRLRVRHVTIPTPDYLGDPTLFFVHGAPISGGLVVVNVGGTKAKIIESRYRIYFTKGELPAIALEEEFRKNLLMPGQILEVGESCGTPINDTIVMEPPPPGVDAELRAFARDGWKLYVMGQIRYQDEGGADRFMGFCRERQSSGRFRAVDDPDYEYED
jgi:hypothetical protein